MKMSKKQKICLEFKNNKRGHKKTPMRMILLDGTNFDIFINNK